MVAVAIVALVVQTVVDSSDFAVDGEEFGE
jgi:hypothetical protein